MIKQNFILCFVCYRPLPKVHVYECGLPDQFPEGNKEEGGGIENGSKNDVICERLSLNYS